MKNCLYLLLPMLFVGGPVDAGEMLAQAQGNARQQMNAELQAVARSHQQQLMELNQRYKQEVQAAATADERSAVQQRYQADMLKLMQETQAKTQAVQKAFQQNSAGSVPSSPAANSTAPELSPDTADRMARIQQMQTELQALGVKYTQRITALGNGFKQDLQTAASAEERTALQQAYQEKIRALQQEAQAETQAIRQRYQ